MNRRFHSLSFECLEPRQMLAAHPLGHGLAVGGQFFPDSNHAHVPVMVSAPLMGTSHIHATILSAKLSDPTNADISGEIQYFSVMKAGMTLTKFSARIEGDPPNTTHPVAIDGVVVGQIMTNAEGEGRLVLSSNPHGNQQPLPANFPAMVAAGDMVTVGTAAGTLGAAGHHGDQDDKDHDDDGQEMRLSAALTDPANAAISGHAKFASETEDGTTEMMFAVHVAGAAASASLDVSINGVVVGQLMTDATGMASSPVE